jgi:hypothetical protein
MANIKFNPAAFEAILTSSTVKAKVKGLAEEMAGRRECGTADNVAGAERAVLRGAGRYDGPGPVPGAYHWPSCGAA